MAAEAFAAGADILAGLYASHEQRKAQSKAASLNSRQRAAAFAMLQKQQREDLLMGNLARSQLLGGQKAELGGFAGAERALGLGALAGRQTVQAQGKLNMADAEQSAVSRGLLGTSVGMQGLQGVGDNTTAQLAALDQGYAAQLAELGLQKSSLMGGHGRELAALGQFERGIQRDYGAELASLAPPVRKRHKKGGFGSKLKGSTVYGALT